ncbi:MAG: UDP-N-acetylmuramate dehydrogenase [Burkholderiales bacterium]|nr:UDP-N-acetylmuramate dehydrogenase [Burkholderiales bacterium]
MLKTITNYDISTLNSLKLSSTAKYYTILDDYAQLENIQQELINHKKFFVLGGGSNIIVPEVYDGLIIHNQLKGIEIIDDGEYYLVTAKAGEIWDDFIAYCGNNGAYGLENLSLIPGTVGASPVQNIGAYGVEVKDFITQIEVYDLNDTQIKYLTNLECNFSYRNSILKSLPNFLVLSVTFRLPKISPMNCNYGDIKSKLEIIMNPSAQDLRNCIIETRNSKLPSPEVIGNAGSFFHNPIIDTTFANALKEQYPNLPCYPMLQAQYTKVSAGWLIDNLGLKGFRQGNFGTYDKQALVIVNHGNGTQSELLDFASFIVNQVKQTYNIELNIEPIIL